MGNLRCFLLGASKMWPANAKLTDRTANRILRKTGLCKRKSLERAEKEDPLGGVVVGSF